MSYSFSGSTTSGENQLQVDATLSALGSPPTSISYTLACWIKMADATPSSNQVVFGIGTTGSTSDWITQIRVLTGGNGGLNVDLGASGTFSASTTDSEADAVNNTWFLIAGTVIVDASSLVTSGKGWTYNGTAEATRNTGTPGTPDNVVTFTRARIGKSISGTGEFTGEIAHAAIWDKELSDAELTELTTKAPNLVAASNLKYYWPLLTDANAHADYGGSGFNLTAGAAASLNNGDGPSITLSSGSSIAPLAAYYAMLRRN